MSGTSVEPGPPVDEAVSGTSTVPPTVETKQEVPTSTTAPAPITGYGDFSGFGPFEIDRYHTTELLVRCIQDQGFAVEVIPPGDGISFAAVPVDQNQAAVDAAEACEAGLGLPELTAADYTDEIRELMYKYQLALRQCLISAGYDIPEPPSRDSFVDNFFNDPWNAYTSVPGSDLTDTGPDSISYRCPQSPPGGLLSWKAGDPIPTLVTVGTSEE
jgi:hypothetical protein